MNIRLKTMRWRKAEIIDGKIAKKIIEFEQKRFDKILEIIFDILGFPVLLISFFLFFIDLSFTYPKETTYLIDVLTLSAFALGFFFTILRKFNINKQMLVPTAMIFSALWAIFSFIMMIDSKMNVVEMLFVWSAIITFSVLIGKKDGLTLVATNAAYFVLAYLFDRTHPRIINLDEHHWITVVFALVSPSFFLVLGCINILKKLFPYLYPFARNHLMPGLKKFLSLVKNKLLEFFRWAGPFRLILGSILIGILILSIVRGRDPFLSQLLWSNEKLYIVCFTGLLILLISLLYKESSNFSVYFSIVGWIEILARLFLITPHGLKFTLTHFHYQPGLLTTTALSIVFIKFLAKKFTSSDLPKAWERVSPK